MNELALFTGAGGGVLAGTLLGWDTVCGVEISPFCARRLLQRQNEGHIPSFPIWDDVCTFDGRPWKGIVDVVSGGFPCQAFSTATHGKATAIDFWPEMLRIVKEVSPSLCSPRMLPLKPLIGQQKTANRLAIKPKSALFPRQTWVLTTFGKDTGFLHTPTCTSNYAAKSMQKHANCRIFVRVFGKDRNPANAEWLMGWPIGWTDSSPLATDKFQRWQQRHGRSLL